MMALQKEFQFTLPTKFSDGSPMTRAIAQSLAYEINITSMDDPATEDHYLVPPANVQAADANGVVTVLFTDIGFTPKIDTLYYVTMFDVTMGVTGGISPDSNSLTFAYGSPVSKPIRPSNLWIT